MILLNHADLLVHFRASVPVLVSLPEMEQRIYFMCLMFGCEGRPVFGCADPSHAVDHWTTLGLPWGQHPRMVWSALQAGPGPFLPVRVPLLLKIYAYMLLEERRARP